MLIEFHVSFPYLVKWYLIFINIVFSLGSDRPPGLSSFHTHSYLFAFLVCLFVLFHSFRSHARVFRKTLLQEFIISYGHTERFHLIFSLFRAKETKYRPSRHCYILEFFPEVTVITIYLRIPLYVDDVEDSWVVLVAVAVYLPGVSVRS